jgi:hypothetical protein
MSWYYVKGVGFEGVSGLLDVGGGGEGVERNVCLKCHYESVSVRFVGFVGCALSSTVFRFFRTPVSVFNIGVDGGSCWMGSDRSQLGI